MESIHCHPEWVNVGHGQVVMLQGTNSLMDHLLFSHQGDGQASAFLEHLRYVERHPAKFRHSVYGVFLASRENLHVCEQEAK